MRLYVEAEEGEQGLGMVVRKATPADLIAAVRRGVESGTIEGIETHLSITSAGPLGLSPGTYLVIPASDGGSET